MSDKINCPVCEPNNYTEGRELVCDFDTATPARDGREVDATAEYVEALRKPQGIERALALLAYIRKHCPISGFGGFVRKNIAGIQHELLRPTIPTAAGADKEDGGAK